MKALWRLAYAAHRIAKQTGSYDSYGEWEGEIKFTFSHGTRAQNRVIRRAIKSMQDGALFKVDQLAERRPGRILQKLKGKRALKDFPILSYNCRCLAVPIDPALIEQAAKLLVEGSQQRAAFYGRVSEGAPRTIHGIIPKDFQPIKKEPGDVE